MPIEIWKAYGYFITVVSAVVISIAFARNRSPATDIRSSAITKGEITVTIALIGIGLFLRANFLTEFLGGQLTSDENMMSVVYTSGIVNGEHVRSGAGKIVYAIVLDAWLLLFGFSVTSIRALSTVACIVGIGFWFLSLRLLHGKRIALWASALLSISIFGIYFGRLSLEVFWPVVFIPICLLIYASWQAHPSLGIAALGGAFVAFGLFTYPGFLIAMIAVFAGLAATWLWAFVKLPWERATLMPSRSTLSDAAVAVFTFLAISFIGLILHRMIFAAPNEAMFTGGGGGHFNISVLPVLLAIKQMLVDLFVEGSSWYLWLGPAPFVEFVLWPFFVTGVLISWGRTQDWKIRGIILSMPVVILLGALTGAYPGMRRAIYLLLPFYLFSAVGIVQLLEITKNWSKERGSGATYLTPISAVIMLVVISLAHPIYYQFTHGRKATSWNRGEGFGTKKIPLEYLLSNLQSNDVILSKKEFGKYFDDLIYEHYPKMVKRYVAHQEHLHSVHFLENKDDPVIQRLADRDDWMFLTWTSREVERLSELLAICVDDKSFLGQDDLPIVVYPRSLQARQKEARCYADAEYGELDSKFQLGYRHKRERLVHRLDCGGPNCDNSRPDFIYTLGGTVTFLLAYEPNMCNSGCELVLQVVNPLKERKCRIAIANQQLGLLSIETLNQENKARFSIPNNAFNKDDTIEVSITPEPGDFSGWDIESAEIVRTGS